MTNDYANGRANGVKRHSKRSSVFLQPDTTTDAIVPPISLSTTYKQDEVGTHKSFQYPGGHPWSYLSRQLRKRNADGQHMYDSCFLPAIIFSPIYLSTTYGQDGAQNSRYTHWLWIHRSKSVVRPGRYRQRASRTVYPTAG
ncbi:hypothetical protein EDB19DRAFT_1831058 [Suillus lakei]|nr:hypothetical protein EDB19DRAFT_1831058 [Suillus lakei]